MKKSFATVTVSFAAWKETFTAVNQTFAIGKERFATWKETFTARKVSFSNKKVRFTVVKEHFATDLFTGQGEEVHRMNISIICGSGLQILEQLKQH